MSAAAPPACVGAHAETPVPLTVSGGRRSGRVERSPNGRHGEEAEIHQGRNHLKPLVANDLQHLRKVTYHMRTKLVGRIELPSE